MSLNSSQRRDNRIRRTSRHLGRMSTNSTLTFAEVIRAMEHRATLGEFAASTLPNLKSALRAFLSSLNIQEVQLVGSTLRRAYYRNLHKHLDMLREEGREPPYIANRKSLLGKWASLVTNLDKVAAASNGGRSPFQTALDEIISNSPAPLGTISEQAGIAVSTFRRWLAGAQPNLRAVPSIRRLERFFGMPSESLVKLAFGGRQLKTEGEDGDGRRIAYRERLAAQTTDTYRLVQVSNSLRNEWMAFLSYKTEKLPILNRHMRGVWVTRPAVSANETESTWFCFTGGRYVPTAAIAWPLLTYFLGWLARPCQLGGAGLSEDFAQSLAWFSNKAMVHRYLNWRLQRSENLAHGGIISIVKFVSALTHPEHGYLTQQPELAANLPEQHRPRDWRDACHETYKWASQTKNTLIRDGMEKSRDPFDPIRDVLELECPMQAVSDMVERMKMDRPLTGGEAEAVWARDLLLIKLLASNPLRARNLKEMTYRHDNRGHLYQRNNGAWFIRFDKSEFKNCKGAARHRDYDMPVAESAWADIERYLKIYRPMFPRANELNFVFLSALDKETEHQSGVWKSLNRRVFTLTKKYLWRCPGTSAHGFRYIFGTSILKSNPDAIKLAALALHDEPETVEAHYAHLRTQDGAAGVHKLLASAYQRM